MVNSCRTRGRGRSWPASLVTFVSHHRHAKPHARSTPRTAHHLYHSIVPVEHLHPLTHVAQPNAGALADEPAHRFRHRAPGLDSDAVIFHLNHQAFALEA